MIKCEINVLSERDEEIFNALKRQYLTAQDEEDSKQRQRIMDDLHGFLNALWRTGYLTTSEQQLLESMFIWL